MDNALDVSLQDNEQINEIELLTELMAIATGSSDALDAGTIDATLGVDEVSLPSQRLSR